MQSVMTTRHLHLGRILVAALILTTAVSCARFEKNKNESASSDSEKLVSQAVSKDDLEAKLRDLVTDYVNAQGRQEGEARSQVIKRKPYYYKEYSVYPDGAESMKVDIQEKDSRTSPYSAEVTLSKQRFATRMHRKRDEAQADSNFLRDTGTETLTFELRGDRWWRVGSLFVADRTEENVNGEWVPAQEEVERTVAAEEKEGNWFNRAWSAISGR